MEQSFLALTPTLRQRADALEARRQALVGEIAEVKGLAEMPLKLLSPGKLQAFCRAMEAKLLKGESGFAKEYLRLFVDEIRLEGSTVILRGSNGVLARAAGEKDLEAPGTVPRFGYAWLPKRNSNRQLSVAERPVWSDPCKRTA